jgi:hypothetical protein
MAKFKALPDSWNEKAVPAKSESSYAVRLPLGDADRWHALAK